MADAADKVVADEERAMELLAQQERERERQALIADSMRGFDPTLPLYCDDCEEQIDPARLAAYPKASRCTACAAAYEKNMRERYPF